MSLSDAVSRQGGGRLVLASIVAVVLVAAIAQQAAPGFQLATPFAEVSRRLPPAIAVLFPLTAILAQIVVVTRLSRWLERRKVGLATGSLAGPGLSTSGASTYGLGLRLVRQRVEQEAHGSIRMETSPSGTRAIVELP